MLLAIDIGNSAIKFGLFDGERLETRFSIPTKRDPDPDELKDAVADRLDHSIDAAIVCSVVSSANEAVRSTLREMTEVDPTFVDNNFDFGFRIDYRPLASLGTDRLVAAYAAVEEFGAPCIVCSMGTATTIDVVSDSREFRGGVIAPGLDVIADALHQKAPRLPRVSADRPSEIIGSSTESAIRSGLYYGYVAMVEGLITRIREESGIVKIIGTGGNADRLAAEFTGMMTVENDLVLHGLRRLRTAN